MYADWNAGACAFTCSIQYFADNRTQQCVPTCPAEWEYFGSILSYACVSLCEDNYYADKLDNRECNLACTGGYFADK